MVASSGRMRDFIRQPAFREEDLGVPLPDSAHACSVCLPTWASVLGYEEGREKVLHRLKAGYPRFLRSPQVERLTRGAHEELCGEGEQVFVFPTRNSAQRAQRWIERRSKLAARSAGYHGFQTVVVPEEAAGVAREYQRFTGELVSSRMAEDWLNGGLKNGSKRELLRRRLATIYGTRASQVSVFGNGMASITALLRSLPGVAEGRKTLQLEFPYVDSLKLQELFGNGVVFLNEAEGESFEEALQRIARGEFAAVFTEVPTNPLLRCVDLERVSAACREGGTPLIVDDSAVGPQNVQVLPLADVVTCSLTKWLSGVGDVMGGAAIVREDSAFADELVAALDHESQETSPPYLGDVQVLLSNLKGYPSRLERANETALELVEMLAGHPAVSEVWHPSRTTTERYDQLKQRDGGYGALLSFALKSARRAPRVYDALEVSKGPSFGTRFTLACPYALLAHFHELDWAAGCGVPSHLIRVSVGDEDSEVLLQHFTDALRRA